MLGILKKCDIVTLATPHRSWNNAESAANALVSESLSRQLLWMQRVSWVTSPQEIPLVKLESSAWKDGCTRWKSHTFKNRPQTTFGRPRRQCGIYICRCVVPCRPVKRSSLLRQQSPGDILVFLTGRDEIERCLEELSEYLPS